MRFHRLCVVLVLGVMLASGTATAQPAAPDTQAQFDAAFEAMTRGDFATAIAGFHAVSATTTDPEQRGAANQLGRLAEELSRRQVRFVAADAPGATPVPLHDTVPVSEDDQPDGGRTSFIISTTIASLYSGVVLLDLLDVNDARTGTLVVMGSTSIGLLGSLYGTRGRTMTGGMADAFSLGLGVGVFNSLLLSGPLGLYDADVNASEKVQSFVLGSAWGVGVAGLVAADSIRPTRAQVSVAGTFGMMGLASTWLSLAIVQPSDLSGNTFLTITAAGLDGGLAAGAIFASKLDWSLSRARLVELGAFLGGLAGGGTSIILFADSGSDNTARLAAGITLAGVWAGFALTTHLTRDMAPDYRYRKPLGGNAMLAPTIIRDAPGLAAVGRF